MGLHVKLRSEYQLLFHAKHTLAIKADGGKFSQRKAPSAIDTVVNDTLTEKTHEAHDALKINQISEVCEHEQPQD